MNKTFFSECRYILLLWLTQAAVCTLGVLWLLVTGNLRIWHLYLNNALNGLMNTVQQPASEVAVTLLTPREHYQRMGGLQAFSRSLVSLLIPKGGEEALGLVQTFTGLASLTGGLLAVALPKPKSRVKVICNSLLISMSTENFLLAFGRSLPVWCLGAVLGWISIPMMNASMDSLFRETIPSEIQGRVYSARNTLQFFTIPVGYLLGGALVDRVFVPFMSDQAPGGLWVSLFGAGKGGGAALFFLVIGVFGALSCLPARRDRYIWALEK